MDSGGFRKFMQSFCFSLTVHPNKLLVATGQCAGHDRNDALVSTPQSPGLIGKVILIIILLACSHILEYGIQCH